MFGRAPRADDLVIPSLSFTPRLASNADNDFAADLKLLGMRHRRGHDLRRTFVTLAQVDGASRDVLKVITHGVSEADIVDMYTSFPWPTLCDAVARLRVPMPARREPAESTGPASSESPPVEAEIGQEMGSEIAVGAVPTVPRHIAGHSDDRAQDSRMILSRWPGLNRRPTVYETVALPLSYIGDGGRLSTRDGAGLQEGRGGKDHGAMGGGGVRRTIRRTPGM